MFVESLRHYIATTDTDEKSWLAGLRDSVLSRALAALHQSPAHNWTLAELTFESDTSLNVAANGCNALLFDHCVTCERHHASGSEIKPISQTKSIGLFRRVALLPAIDQHFRCIGLRPVSGFG